MYSEERFDRDRINKNIDAGVSAARSESLFIDTWQRPARSYWYFCAPFLVLFVAVMLNAFGFLPSGIVTVVFALCVFYCVMSVVRRDDPEVNRYLWLTGDKFANRDNDFLGRFVEGLIEEGVIDKRTRTSAVSYGIDASKCSEDIIAVWLDLRQAGKTPEFIEKALQAITPAVGAYGCTYEREGNTRHLCRYEFSNQIDKMTKDYSYEDFLDVDTEYRMGDD